ncbi:tetratricopeptide repeat protein [bacterium]|nr:tetratricopeptide repeat protein [bacterium]
MVPCEIPFRGEGSGLDRLFSWIGLILLGAGLTAGCESKSAQTPGDRLAQALAALDAGELAAAEEQLLGYLQEHPESQVAHDELRWLYFNQFRLRDVERLAREGVEEHPGEHAYLMHALMTEFRPPVPQEGLPYLEGIEQQYPGQWRVLVALGYAHWQIGHLDRARENFNAALELAPSNLETRLTVAEFLLEQTQFSTVKDLLAPWGTPLAPVSPCEQNDRWWAIQAQLAMSQKDWAVALGCLQHAQKLRSWDIAYVQQIGAIFQQMGRAEEAAAAFKSAHELEENQMALNELVLSGAVTTPTPAVCEEVAQRCEFRGQTWLAKGWRTLGKRLRSGTAALHQ